MTVQELIVLLQRQKNQRARVLLMTGGAELYEEVDHELRELPVDGSVVICPKS